MPGRFDSGRADSTTDHIQEDKQQNPCNLAASYKLHDHNNRIYIKVCSDKYLKGN